MNLKRSEWKIQTGGGERKKRISSWQEQHPEKRETKKKQKSFCLSLFKDAKNIELMF